MKNYGEEILQMVDICKVFDLGDGKKLHAAEKRQCHHPQR